LHHLVGEAADYLIHSLGHQHPHGYGLYLCGASGPQLLAYGNYGARFLASAFASGPALLIIFCLILKRVGSFDAGEKAIQTLSKIVAYALATSIFFVTVELFTAFYSNIPEHTQAFRYLFVGLEGHTNLVAWMTASAVLAFCGVWLYSSSADQKT